MLTVYGLVASLQTVSDQIANLSDSLSPGTTDDHPAGAAERITMGIRSWRRERRG